MFKLDLNKIIYNERLGTGGFGVVHPYRDPNNPKDDKWVVKCIVQKSAHVAKAIQEVVLGFSCMHPNVLAVKGYHMSFDEENENWVINMKLPRMKKNLQDLLDQKKKTSVPLTQEEIIKLFYGIASGLAYLHDRKIIHRDIKLDNILIGPNGEPVIADIGIGLCTENETNITVSDWAGSSQFKAPEIAGKLKLQKGDLYKTDLWSLGIVMTKLCLGKDQKLIDVVSAEKGLEKEILVKTKLRELKDKYDHDLLGLIGALVCNNPADRNVTAQQIVEVLKSRYSNILNVNENDCIVKGSHFEKSNSIQGQKNKEHQSEPETHKVQTLHCEQIVLGQENKNLHEFSLPQIKSNKPLEEKKNDIVPEIPVQPTQKIQKKKSAEMSPETLKAFKQLNKLKEEMNTKWGKIFRLAVAKEPLRLLLDLENPDEVKDENFGKFMKDLCEGQDRECLASLEGVRFSFAYCTRLSVRGIRQALVKIASNCSNFSFLELNLWGYKQDTDGLCEQIGKTLPQLRHLKLFMEEFEFVNRLVVDLARLLPKLTELEGLSLNFGSNNNINCDAMQELLSCIGENAPNLTKLQLYFNDCLDITDDEIAALSNQFRIDLENLKSLELMLSGCTGVSEKTIYELGKTIGAKLKLHEFEFGIVRIPISEKGEQLLRAALGHIPKCNITTK